MSPLDRVRHCAILTYSSECPSRAPPRQLHSEAAASVATSAPARMPTHHANRVRGIMSEPSRTPGTPRPPPDPPGHSRTRSDRATAADLATRARRSERSPTRKESTRGSKSPTTARECGAIPEPSGTRMCCHVGAETPRWAIGPPRHPNRSRLRPSSPDILMQDTSRDSPRPGRPTGPGSSTSYSGPTNRRARQTPPRPPTSRPAALARDVSQEHLPSAVTHLRGLDRGRGAIGAMASPLRRSRRRSDCIG